MMDPRMEQFEPWKRYPERCQPSMRWVLWGQVPLDLSNLAVQVVDGPLLSGEGCGGGAVEPLGVGEGFGHTEIFVFNALHAMLEAFKALVHTVEAALHLLQEMSLNIPSELLRASLSGLNLFAQAGLNTPNLFAQAGLNTPNLSKQAGFNAPDLFAQAGLASPHFCADLFAHDLTDLVQVLSVHCSRRVLFDLTLNAVRL